MANKTKVIKSHKVSFMQLNCAKTRQAMTELEKLVQESNDKDLHIISLQEPSWLSTKANRLAGFKDLRSYHHPHTNDNRTRAAIVASRELNCFPIYDFTGPDVATVLTELDGKEVYICSAYLDGTADIQEPENILPTKLTELLNFVKLNNKEIILCTDSNSHSVEWYSPQTDKRGEIMEDILNEFNLKLLNNSSKPTFVGACATNGGTHIDLTAVTVGLVSKLNKWEVTDEVHYSDHNLIRFRAIDPHNIKRDKTWSFKKGDWELYKFLMLESSKSWTNPEVWTTEVINKEVAELYKHLHK